MFTLHRLGFGCLGNNHSARFCTQSKKCGSTKRHHHLLHRSEKPSATKGASAKCSIPTEEVGMGVLNIPVRNYKFKYVMVNPFVDEGSNTSLSRIDFISGKARRQPASFLVRSVRSYSAQVNRSQEKEHQGFYDMENFGVEKEETVVTPEDQITVSIGETRKKDFTRIGLATKVAGLDDTLGLAKPLIIKAKIRLWELGTRGLE
ncbi:hypothetical protein OUZ56_012390 [Daphnia magna]|uniref:Uncharacterized protein n=1 Tax=Daphnia magna TaxID=35525 RepID=A0ABQ9Z2V9_9CRUS|nr:hypothetical protein OUZ56_012390 [Daphnia magna]